MRPAMPPRPNSGQSVEMPQVQCCRCKGYRSPGNCPHFNPAPSNQSSVQHRPPSNKRSFQPLKSGGPPHQTTTPSSNTVSATGSSSILKENTTTGFYTPNQLITVPQQLVVPIRIAIIDTGASYTLIHESLWTELQPQDNLQPWTLGPLYLANSEAEVPLRWINLQIVIHSKTFTVWVAVLTSKVLAYAVILGLEYTCGEVTTPEKRDNI